MILPAPNKKDLIDIPKKVLKTDMEFIFVEDIKEVLAHALVGKADKAAERARPDEKPKEGRDEGAEKGEGRQGNGAQEGEGRPGTELFVAAGFSLRLLEYAAHEIPQARREGAVGGHPPAFRRSRGGTSSSASATIRPSSGRARAASS